MNEEKLFNIYIKKKDILNDCQESLFNDKENEKVSNFLITYNEILKMHLTIFLDIENNNNLTIIIDYLCILILLLNIPNNPEEAEEAEIDQQIRIIKDTLNYIITDKKISNTNIIKLKKKIIEITKKDDINKLINNTSDYNSFISSLTSEESNVIGGTGTGIVAPGTGAGTGVPGDDAHGTVTPGTGDGIVAPGDGAHGTVTPGTGDGIVAPGDDAHGTVTPGTGAPGDDAHSTVTPGTGAPGDDAHGTVTPGTGDGIVAPGDGAPGTGTVTTTTTTNGAKTDAPDTKTAPNTTTGNDDNISKKLSEILKMKIMHDILLFNKTEFNDIKNQISYIH